jgi:hypothetical protein
MTRGRKIGKFLYKLKSEEIADVSKTYINVSSTNSELRV